MITEVMIVYLVIIELVVNLQFAIKIVIQNLSITTFYITTFHC